MISPINCHGWNVILEGKLWVIEQTFKIKVRGETERAERINQECWWKICSKNVKQKRLETQTEGLAAMKITEGPKEK